MKLGIMQPYFVPYIGYWQLMNAVDKYLIYDDVNFIKGGWINRNRILVNNQPCYFNIPMLGASPNKLIKDVGVNCDPRLVDKNLRVLESAYGGAPFFSDVFPIMESILRFQTGDIASYIEHSFQVLCPYLGIKTELIRSSSVQKNCSLRGQDKVLHICELLGASEYFNAVGGQELYSFEEFKTHGIALKFLETNPIEYKQFGGEFQPNLSIIDVMMFNDRARIREFLEKFSLLEHATMH